jgi:hypothetical protein
MRFEVYPNFITVEEQEEIIKWVEDNFNYFKEASAAFSLNQEIISNKTHTTPLRLNTRRTLDIQFPKLVYTIQTRVLKTLRNITITSNPNFLYGKDAITLHYTKFGEGNIAHTDHRIENENVITCNVLVKKPKEGAVLYLDNKPVKTSELALHCYDPCNYCHAVSVNEDPDTDRILIIYRFASTEKW